jgi:hypothetical protein
MTEVGIVLNYKRYKETMLYDINKKNKSNLLKEYYCIMKKYNMQNKN